MIGLFTGCVWIYISIYDIYVYNIYRNNKVIYIFKAMCDVDK